MRLVERCGWSYDSGMLYRITLMSVIGWTFVLGAPAARGDETAIRAALRDYLGTQDAARRAEIVRKVESDSTYSPAKLSGWLHTCGVFEALPTPRTEIAVHLPDGRTLPITVRVPAAYSPNQAWPLIYALHGTGGDGESIIVYLERLLGQRVDQFVIAAPSGYASFEFKSAICTTAEHVAALGEIRRRVNIDSDQILVTGYSRGGHGSWTLAIAQPDMFAASMPLSGTFIIPEFDQLFEVFLTNTASLPVFFIWGKGDVLGPDGRSSDDGGIAALNRQLAALGEKLKLPLTGVELPDRGHGGVAPPPEVLEKFLTARRDRLPKKVQQKMRMVDEGNAYWIETLGWSESWWGDRPIQITLRDSDKLDDPAAERAAVGRAIRNILGSVSGSITGNQVRVDRKRVSDFAIWFCDYMIDWNQPVEVRVGSNRIHNGPLRRDLGVALAQAARTRDFERLRWAGLRFVRNKSEPITADMQFPPLRMPDERPKKP